MEQKTQFQLRKRIKPTGLVLCNYCGRPWLSRSNSPVLTCSKCGNHVIVRENTVTVNTDIFENQNQSKKTNEKVGGDSNLRPVTQQTDNTNANTQIKGVER